MELIFLFGTTVAVSIVIMQIFVDRQLIAQEKRIQGDYQREIDKLEERIRQIERSDE
ncbi:hypothetical protein FLK61_24545 [Paenalkalicoccus suaedae]|uniref:Uncharacterized protein n=1 Tax=Paenalkalicoccus suaedae TaxID=2592382 RepID=A0A859FAZ4_9BACI|nr:hypothetical protein [Paenalkalicoccus suaedae]QKS69952.1 hypothetical protein FLK61_24545 [Paenalkalicoccus suaedae]